MPGDVRLVNEAQRLIYCFVEADPDTRPEELERAVTGFMFDDAMHRDGERKAVQVVASFVTAPDIKKVFGFPADFPVGWMVGFRVEDPAIFRRVVNGDAKPLPVFKYTSAERNDMEKQTPSERMPESTALDNEQVVKDLWYEVLEREADLLMAKSAKPLTRAKALVMAQDRRPDILAKLMHHCDPAAQS